MRSTKTTAFEKHTNLNTKTVAVADGSGKFDKPGEISKDAHCRTARF
jgi:hypothetical protein